MPVARQWAYFDHAAVAPLTEPARAVLAAWAEDVASNGDAHWPQWAERLETTRRHGAELIGAHPDEIALVRNTTEGINLVAEGFPWRSGDNVVTLADEFPSNLYPWMNLADRGVETRRVPTDGGRVNVDALAAACDTRTRIVAISWVGYASGWRNDLDQIAELAHARGAYFFLDAIQGLGVFPLDVSRTSIDFLAADGHKWLLGPEGAGLFYLRREHLNLLRPFGLGWSSVVQGSNFSHVELNIKPSASRYEGGTPNMGGQVALGLSLELLLSLGQEAIAERVLQITSLLCQRLKEIGATIISSREPPHASGIVSFELAGKNPILVRKHCLDQHVVLSCRGGRLRASPHAYNNEEDIERLISALNLSLSI
jgi:selenocysteine lyase/cysteine desulfurase